MPFRDGVFLCDKVGLASELRPLILYPGLPLPADDENYLINKTLSHQHLGWKVIADTAGGHLGSNADVLLGDEWLNEWDTGGAESAAHSPPRIHETPFSLL